MVVVDDKIPTIERQKYLLATELEAHTYNLS